MSGIPTQRALASLPDEANQRYVDLEFEFSASSFSRTPRLFVEYSYLGDSGAYARSTHAQIRCTGIELGRDPVFPEALGGAVGIDTLV